MMQRALGDAGFAVFQSERGVSDTYTLTAVQAEAILRMTLGQLVNLEQEKLGTEYQKLLEEITEYLRILSDDKIILGMIRDDCRAEAEASRRAAHGNQRRGNRLDRPGRPDHRRDDGRHDQPQRLHQAHAGQHLSRPAPRRQGHEGGQDRRRRSDRAPVRGQHARLPAVLHQPRQGLLAEGVRPAAA